MGPDKGEGYGVIQKKVGDTKEVTASPKAAPSVWQVPENVSVQVP